MRQLEARLLSPYLLFGAPLGAALVGGGFTVASIAAACAAIALFTMRESLLIVLGHRGALARRAFGAEAASRLTGLALVALVAIVAAIMNGGAPVARWIAISGGVALGAVALELWWLPSRGFPSLRLMVAMTGACVPVAVGGGAHPVIAFHVWQAWAVAFTAAIAAAAHAAEVARGRAPGAYDVATVIFGFVYLALDLAGVNPEMRRIAPLVAVAILVILTRAGRWPGAVQPALAIATLATAALLSMSY